MRISSLATNTNNAGHRRRHKSTGNPVMDSPKRLRPDKPCTPS